jgi:hypothetical protein
VIGLEPSCLAVWRGDAAELLPEDSRVAEVGAGVVTLAELLANPRLGSTAGRDGDLTH